MLPWQPFDVVRCVFCIYTSSKIQLLNHSIYHGSICQIYHLLGVYIDMPLRPTGYILLHNKCYIWYINLINMRYVYTLYMYML